MGKRLVSGLLIAMLVAGTVLTVGATDVQDAKDKEQQLEEQRDQLAAEKNSLSQRVKKLSNSMKEAEAALEKKQEEIEAAEQELIMAKLDESDQYKSMRLRIKYTYENGNVDIIQMFMESESIADFITRTEYVTRMSDYDREKLSEFQNTVRKVEEKELVLQAEYEKVKELQMQLSDQRLEAEQLLKSKSAELSGIQSDLTEIREQIKKAEEEERRRQEAAEAEKESNQSTPAPTQPTPSQPSEPEKEEKPADGNTSSPAVGSNSTFTHPCPGMSYQSSYFGEVRHGIGDTKPHKGHDYAAAKGTPIYAAADGEVLIAGYSYSAGYWVVINHGNGLTTKYMHMYQRPMVSAGQHVSKGQQIGGVGTTGQSTGNHLHFQVEEYGVPVNPSKYM